MKNKLEIQKVDSPIWLLSLGLIVFFVWLAWHLIDYQALKDRFASLGSLFSGLGFVGLLGTLHYAKKASEAASSSNTQSARIARDNIRAQYLFLKLQQLNPNYSKLIPVKYRVGLWDIQGQEVKTLEELRSSSCQLFYYNFKDDDVSYYDDDTYDFIIEKRSKSEILRQWELKEKYGSIEKELNEITTRCNSDNN